jgi:ankyrin repeat protein
MALSPVDEATQKLVDELVGNAHGNLVRVKEIVVSKPDLVNEKATWEETPMQAAAQMGNRPIIEFLLNHGAHVDFFTALVLGRLDDIDRGLREQPDRAQARGIHDLPALYFAAIGGNTAAAQRVLDAGADVNAHAQAAAPIHGAIMGGNVEMVRLLLERGADPSLNDYSGRDARALALEIKRADIAALFN